MILNLILVNLLIYNSFIIYFIQSCPFHLFTVMMTNIFLQLFTFQESSGDRSNSPFSSHSQYRNTLDRSSHRPGAGNNVLSEIKGGGKLLETEQLNLDQRQIKSFWFTGIQSSTLPSSLRNKRTLKSSLSKTSSLKRNTTNKFETQENLQQIVKQKRENCLQVKHSCPQG